MLTYVCALLQDIYLFFVPLNYAPLFLFRLTNILAAPFYTHTSLCSALTHLSIICSFCSHLHFTLLVSMYHSLVFNATNTQLSTCREY